MEWAYTVQHLQAVAFHDEWRQFFQSLRGDNKSEMELVTLEIKHSDGTLAAYNHPKVNNRRSEIPVLQGGS